MISSTSVRPRSAAPAALGRLPKTCTPRPRARIPMPPIAAVPAPPPPMPAAKTPRAWLTQHNGAFTLVLSAGFFGFYAHAGVLAGLEEAGLRPGRVVGISAGAITGGFYAAGLSPAHIGQVMLSLTPEDFMDPGRLGLLQGQKFADKINRELPTLPSGQPLRNLEDCPIPFTAVAYDLCKQQTKLLSCGPIAPAMRASSAFPLLFQPVRAGGTLCTDGAVRDPLGLRAVQDQEPVLLHALPSQSPIKWLTQRLTPKPTDTAQRRVLRIADLPAVPMRQLQLGAQAMQHAHAATRLWLDTGRQGG